MPTNAGRFESNDEEAASRVIGKVLEKPGRWCNLFFEPIDDGSIPDESPLFGLFAARGPANPLATIMSPLKKDKKEEFLLQVGIQHRAGTKAAKQLKAAELYGPDTARVIQDHPRRGLVVKWPRSADVQTLTRWLFPAMRELSRAPTTDAILWEIRE